MLTEDDIQNLPDDPDLALAIMADQMESEVGPAMANNEFGTAEGRTWWGDIQAHINVHRMQDRYPLLAPEPPGDQKTFWDWFDKFRQNLRHYRTTIYFHQKRNSTSVVLSAKHKKRVHELLNEIRQLIEKMDISIEKREAIFRLIARLQSEVDRERTNVQSLLHMILEVSGVVKKVGEDAKPFVDRVRELLGIVTEARDNPEPKKVGKPEQKKIDKSALDDDIPF